MLNVVPLVACMALVRGPHMERGRVVWVVREWLPGSPWFICCVGDAGCIVASRYGGFLALVSIAGPLVVLLSRVFRQGPLARSLDSLRLWVFVLCPGCNFGSSFCGGLSPYCVAHVAMFLWLVPPLFRLALASHRGLARDWWVMFGLCVTLDQWHAVWVSLASWLRYCVTLGSWCKVVRREPDMFYVPWWLPHTEVRCQGLLRWLAHAARTYGFGSFGPCLGWGYSAQLWFSFPVTWCASFRSRVDLWVLRCLSRKSPCRFLMHDLPCTRACHGVLHRPPWLCHYVASLPLGCAVARPWARGARLCAANLICSMSLGGSRTQGCDAKASCAGWRMPLAPRALGVLVPALAGATRPNCGLL
ncbi:hypothetical protein V6N11_018394 [Hibiscus sabdariffa]|uniref:Uncharacterized protein n=1 Tax=Hibiscus sabdariffa TaxID=183260 RepID=A0ABR2T7B1_9ROSI